MVILDLGQLFTMKCQQIYENMIPVIKLDDLKYCAHDIEAFVELNLSLLTFNEQILCFTSMGNIASLLVLVLGFALIVCPFQICGL